MSKQSFLEIFFLGGGGGVSIPDDLSFNTALVCCEWIMALQLH